MIGGSPADPHPNVAMLRDVYADLTTIDRHVHDDVVLHLASGEGTRVGKKSVVDAETELIRTTGGTLVMDVQHIVANDHFGAVLGTLRAGRGCDIAMPFCGLWRFKDGRIIEHWENAYDAAALGRFLAVCSSRSAEC